MATIDTDSQKRACAHRRPNQAGRRTSGFSQGWSLEAQV